MSILLIINESAILWNGILQEKAEGSLGGGPKSE